jgi:hypothetical protein
MDHMSGGSNVSHLIRLPISSLLRVSPLYLYIIKTSVSMVISRQYFF